MSIKTIEKISHEQLCESILLLENAAANFQQHHFLATIFTSGLDMILIDCGGEHYRIILNLED